MPKSRATRDSSLAQAAALIVERLLRKLVSHTPPKRGAGVDAVHDMRVAAKRLREAVRLFSPALGKKDAKRHLAWIEELNDALGAVRSLDVLLERLQQRAPRSRAPRSLPDLRARLRRERDAAEAALGAVLRRFRQGKAAKDLRRRLERHAKKKSGGPTVEEFATRAILDRLDEVLARWERLRVDASPRALHRLRISNKRLRYALEPFHDWLPPAAHAAERSANRLHDALGDLHDEDEILRVLETALCSATPGDRAAWAALCRDAERRRRRDLEAALRVLDGLAAGGWAALRETLEAETRLAAAETRAKKR